MAEIKCIRDLLKMDLDIPGYQRPYKWNIRNIVDLLNDIGDAINDAETYGSSFKYRIGTIILHRNNKGKMDIVDGQQRIISLVLLLKYLEPSFVCSILNIDFTNKVTQANIYKNYRFIEEWFSLKKEVKRKYLDAFEKILEVVVISVDKVAEAFQLFDSQNTRGKELDPHDLLKAYHLREMKKYPYEMEHAVTKWEAKDTKDIRNLFKVYLFPVWNWSRGIKTKPFTAKEIDTYKGITEDKGYSYARRAGKAMPYFQITEPFLAGNDFFEMVDHYLWLLDDVQREMERNTAFEVFETILKKETGSVGFSYTRDLFYCALLCYYDKFHNFDELAVKKLFTWAYMLRVDMVNLGYDSINKYAVGEENDRYTNSIPIFAKINVARLHTDIAGIPVKVIRNTDKASGEKWDWLYDKLKEINGLTGVSE